MEKYQFEMEKKFRVTNPQLLREKLQELGAFCHGREKEVDQYFRSPVRDFATTGEALRVRQVGTEQVLTYKGSRIPGPTKIRKELEMGIQPKSGSLGELLICLGFEPLPEIRKWRETYLFPETNHPKDITLCLDDAEGLGWFAEIEILAQLAEKDQAILRINELAGKLELTDLEDRSYLRMHLEKNR